MDLDVHRWRLFVTVAESGSISRAASSLGADQPAVSRALRRLERSLGGQLFVRSASGASLTPLAEALLPQARTMLAAVDEFQARAITAARGARDVVRVGTLEFYPFTSALAAARRAVMSGADPVHLEVVDLPWLGHAQAVHDRKVDLGFTLALNRTYHHSTDTQFAVIKPEPTLFVLLPDRHRLADERTVSPAELADDVLHLPRPSDNPQAHEYLKDVLTATGLVSPRRVIHTGSFSAVLQHIAAGEGWTVVAGGVATRPVPGTVARPVAGFTPRGLELVAIWRRDADDRVLRDLVRRIRAELVDLQERDAPTAATGGT